MKRFTSILAAACLATLAFGGPAAHAAFPSLGNFGINSFDVTITNENGTTATEAGSHPFAFTTSLHTNVDSAEPLPEGWLKDIFVEQMPGLVGDTTAYPRCTTREFLEIEEGINNCPIASQVGIAASATSRLGTWSTAPVFNLTPPPGVLLRLGFHAVVPDIVIDVTLNPDPPYNAIATSRNTPQLVPVYGSKIQLWGDPANDAHDEFRGLCGRQVVELPPDEFDAFEFENQTGESCPTEPRPKPFLTLPTNCSEALRTSYEAFSWEGEFDAGSVLIHDAAGNPQPFTGCGGLPSFSPSISARPTSRAAESPTGLDFTLAVKDEGLTSLKGRSKSHIRKAVVTLPEGMTANPSIAEGLEVCSEGDLRRETLHAAPGVGCPEASKIGTIEVESPLVEETVKGALFQATPYENLADDALLAFYIVLKNPKLGIIVKQPVEVEAHPKTGQLVATTDEIPQLPFSSFRLKFKEGGRSPLVSPPTCGDHEVEAVITPWSGQRPVETPSTFTVVSGPNEGPCPPGGTQPFVPGFEAGSLNNAAGAFSPFAMRLTRRDGDQDLVRFDATLPPGMVAKLAGVPWCPDAAIARARGRDGKDELRSPSCPAASQIGSVQGGAGVGSQLTYVPGKVYLAGPVGGAPLSVVGIVPAVAGPFDVGTIVVRQALDLDPITGQARVVSAASDDLPHILAGIPLRVRDIQVSVHRPNFTLNPTSCNPMATLAGIWGGGSHVFSPHDDFPVLRQARFQAASCAALGFKPRLAIKLRGGVKRGAHPALRAHVRPRPGDANFSRAVVTLPTSAFLDQAHIRTICTRVQFHAPPGHGAHCPPGARYGFARAWSPLLDGPVTGPVYLRSSDNNLPDLVAALTGPPSAAVQVELSARIDSVKGGIRSTFTGIPDVPVSRFLLDMQGGKKGLIVNSRHLCHKPKRNRARSNLRGQNGKFSRTRPVVRAVKCKKNKRRKAKRSSHRRRP